MSVTVLASAPPAPQRAPGREAARQVVQRVDLMKRCLLQPRQTVPLVHLTRRVPVGPIALSRQATQAPPHQPVTTGNQSTRSQETQLTSPKKLTGCNDLPM